MAELPEPAFWESAGDWTDDPNEADGWALEHEAGTRSALTTLYTADQLRAAIQAEMEKIAADWEYRHGFDKHGVAAFIRGQADGQE